MEGLVKRDAVGARKVESVSQFSPAPVQHSAFTLMQQLFLDLRQGSGTVVIAAADGPGYAYEKEGHGLFTFCLLEGMQMNKETHKANADFNKNGTVTVTELQKYITMRVAEMSGGDQRPNARHEDVEFDFGFSGAAPSAPRSSTQPKPSGTKNTQKRH